MWGGFFVIVPLVSLHFVDNLGWTAAIVGAALGIRTISQQGISVISGILADRFDSRHLILLGLAIRVLGFAALALVKDGTGLLLAMLLSGIGGAFFEAPKNAAVAALTDPESRSQAYAVFGVIGNVGMAGGSLLGVLLHKIGFEVAALASAGFYLLTFLGCVWALPSLRVSSGALHPLLGIREVLQDRRFFAFYYAFEWDVFDVVTVFAWANLGWGAFSRNSRCSGLDVFGQYCCEYFVAISTNANHEPLFCTNSNPSNRHYGDGVCAMCSSICA